MPENEAMQCGLRNLNTLLTQAGQSFMDYNIPMPDVKVSECDEAQEYDIHKATVMGGMPNTQHRQVANAVLHSVMSPNVNTVLLEWTRREWQDFTYNYLVTEWRGRGYKVATATWTGIAFTLLIGGRTVHSLFKLTVPLLDTSSCNVSLTSSYNAMLSEVSLFIVDESSMVPVQAFDVIDRSQGTIELLEAKYFCGGRLSSSSANSVAWTSICHH